MNFPLCLLLSGICSHSLPVITFPKKKKKKKDIRLKIPKRYCTSKVNLVPWNS